MPIFIDPSNNIKYAYSSTGELDDIETAKVITSNDVSGNLIILSQFTINDKLYLVTSISDNSFRNGNNITSVVIPDGVTSIGHYAFSSCAKLRSIVIPDSVNSIGNSAFNDCFYLESIDIQGNITTIDVNTFVGCANIRSITIPESVTSIGKNAFAYCSKLSSFTIPNNVTSIGDCAFGHCSRLLSIDIPENVISIGVNAFNSCVRLASVRFISNQITICDRAFDEIASPAIAYVKPGAQIANMTKYFNNTIMMYTPLISSINPNNGSTSASTKVTLIGSSLTNIVAVLFGSKKASSVTVINDCQIDVIVPTRIDAGTVDVTIIDIYNKEFIISDGYTYLPLSLPLNNNHLEWLNKEWVNKEWVNKEQVTSYVNRIKSSLKI